MTDQPIKSEAERMSYGRELEDWIDRIDSIVGDCLSLSGKIRQRLFAECEPLRATDIDKDPSLICGSNKKLQVIHNNFVDLRRFLEIIADELGRIEGNE